MADDKNSSSTSSGRGRGSSLKLLPEDFVPSFQEVIVGRGRKIANHPGNVHLKTIVRSKLEDYSTANDKTHKSYIISQIFQEIREGSDHGGFVKKDPETGHWYCVKDACARTNIAQCFRDELHETYRSSKFAKQRRRWGNSKMPAHKGTVGDGASEAAPDASLFGMAVRQQQDSFISLQRESLQRMMQHNFQQEAFLQQQQQQALNPAMLRAPAVGSGGRNGFDEARSGVTNILCAALDVIKTDEVISTTAVPAPIPSFPLYGDTAATEVVNQDTLFDTFLPLAFTPAEESDPMGNPFEPLPIWEGSM